MNNQTTSTASSPISGLTGTPAGSIDPRPRSPRLFAALATLLLLTGSICGPVLRAQTLDAGAGSTFWVDGSSTLHDWTIETKTVGGTIQEEDGVIRAVNLTIPVRSLKSGKSAMEDKRYDALDAKKHPNITINASEVTFKGDSAQVSAQVTVNGITRTMGLTVMRVMSDGRISFTGRTGFKMTDFKVTPPQAMLGAVKAGDEIMVRFDLRMSPKTM